MIFCIILEDLLLIFVLTKSWRFFDFFFFFFHKFIAVLFHWFRNLFCPWIERVTKSLMQGNYRLFFKFKLLCIWNTYIYIYLSKWFLGWVGGILSHSIFGRLVPIWSSELLYWYMNRLTTLPILEPVMFHNEFKGGLSASFFFKYSMAQLSKFSILALALNYYF